MRRFNSYRGYFFLCILSGMHALSILVLVGLLACSPQETGSQGGGGSAPVVQPQEPEGAFDEDEDKGSMCELYGTNVAEVEVEGHLESLPVPVLCDPYFLYTGYPADQPELPEDVVREMRLDIGQ